MPVLRDAGGVIADDFVRGQTLLDWPCDLPGNDPARQGIHVPNTVDPAALVPVFDRVGLISVAFPSFSDGRGFSIARRLRALGFTGRLRATGPVIADQLDYLLACGFSEVETPAALDARQPQDQWDRAVRSVGVAYQRGYSGRLSILEARRAARVTQ